MPILSLVSNGGLTAYSNKLSRVLFAYNNSGYSGKDPLWHATTAWVTAANRQNHTDYLFFDALLVAAGGGGGSGGNHGGGGGGGYMFASGVQLGSASNYIEFEVGMARPPEAGKTGPKGENSMISAGNLYAYGGGGGSGNGPAHDSGFQGAGTVGYYTRTNGKGSGGGGAQLDDYTYWQGNMAGESRFANPDYIGGGGGGAGSAGSPVNPSSPSLSTQAGAGGGGTTVGLAGHPNSIGISGGGGGAHSSTTNAGRAPGGGNGGSGGFYVQIGGGNPAGTVGVGPVWNDQLGANASGFGGGGGASTSSIWGGRGGNGVIYIRYPIYHANATVYCFPESGDRDECIAEYYATATHRFWKFTAKNTEVTPDGKNYSHAKARLYLPHRTNHILDSSVGLNNRPHRLYNQTAGGDANAFPHPSAFGPFSTNGWGISLNEDSPIASSNHYTWLTYPNNLSDFADIGTGDFMLQAYVKKTGYYSDGSGTGRSQPILFLEYANTNSIEFGNFVDPGVNNFGYMGLAQAGVPITGTVAASDNVWYKVRIQRSLGVVSVFVDDVRVGVGADATDYAGTPTKVWIGYNGYASAWDVRAFVGQISGLVFRKGSTNVFDLRNSNNFRNKLNPKVVIPQNRNRDGAGGDTPRPSCFLTGSLDTYSTTNFPSSDKRGSIYWDGSATVNTSITWDGYFPDGVPNSSPTYVFTANTGDFCVDGWVYPTSNIASVIFTMGSGYEDYFTVYAHTGDRRIGFEARRSPINTSMHGPYGGLIANTWTHFAVQRESGVIKVFTNGELGDTLSDSGAATFNFNDATVYPTIAGRFGGQDRFTGYMSQLRYSRFARYGGSSYTVPTTPVAADSSSLFINGDAGGSIGPPIWDATQKNQFLFAGALGTVTTTPINSSENVASVRYITAGRFVSGYNGNGSLYSDGNGHFVKFIGPHNQRNFKFGTADFCVEGWWIADYVPSQKTLIDFRSSTAQIAFALKIDTSNRILFVVQNTTQITSAPITLGTSVHIAIERVSGVTTLYIDGLRSGATYADTNDYVAVQNRPVLFTNGASEENESFIGSMNVLRVTKDYPRYSANFSAGPTAIFDTIGLNQTFLPYNLA